MGKQFEVIFVLLLVGGILILLGSNMSRLPDALPPASTSARDAVPPASFSAPPAPPPPHQQPPTLSGTIPAGFTKGDLSPYFGKVSIGWISPLQSTVPASYGELTLYNYIGSGEGVRITGWRVVSNKKSFFIPKGIEVFAPLFGNTPADIVMKSGDRVSIYSHASLVQVNLRLNKCIGYKKGFTPPMPQICPKPTQADLLHLSGTCQSYILGLGACELPGSSAPIPVGETACYDYLSTLNYQGCYDAHRADPDFLLPEWRIWLGNFSEPQVNIFDSLHDRALLFDGAGKLVDEYIY